MCKQNCFEKLVTKFTKAIHELFFDLRIRKRFEHSHNIYFLAAQPFCFRRRFVFVFLAVFQNLCPSMQTHSARLALLVGRRSLKPSDTGSNPGTSIR
jgi:hypothetical protein